MVKQLAGEKIEIPKAEGRKVIQIGIVGKYKACGVRPGKHDEVVLAILKEAGPLTTPEIFEEAVMLGHIVTREALLIICKKLQGKGLLMMRKMKRAGGAGKGVNVWELADPGQSS